MGQAPRQLPWKLPTLGYSGSLGSGAALPSAGAAFEGPLDGSAAAGAATARGRGTPPPCLPPAAAAACVPFPAATAEGGVAQDGVVAEDIVAGALLTLLQLAAGARPPLAWCRPPWVWWGSWPRCASPPSASLPGPLPGGPAPRTCRESKTYSISKVTSSMDSIVGPDAGFKLSLC